MKILTRVLALLGPLPYSWFGWFKILQWKRETFALDWISMHMTSLFPLPFLRLKYLEDNWECKTDSAHHTRGTVMLSQNPLALCSVWRWPCWCLQWFEGDFGEACSGLKVTLPLPVLRFTFLWWAPNLASQEFLMSQSLFIYYTFIFTLYNPL